MKELILEYLRNHPESRKRYIASDLGVWQCSKVFLTAMTELEQEGKIKATYHHEPENMEFYDTFSVVGA